MKLTLSGDPRIFGSPLPPEVVPIDPNSFYVNEEQLKVPGRAKPLTILHVVRRPPPHLGNFISSAEGFPFPLHASLPGELFYNLDLSRLKPPSEGIPWEVVLVEVEEDGMHCIPWEKFESSGSWCALIDIPEPGEGVEVIAAGSVQRLGPTSWIAPRKFGYRRLKPSELPLLQGDAEPPPARTVLEFREFPENPLPLWPIAGAPWWRVWKEADSGSSGYWVLLERPVCPIRGEIASRGSLDCIGNVAWVVPTASAERRSHLSSWSVNTDRRGIHIPQPPRPAIYD